MESMEGPGPVPRGGKGRKLTEEDRRKLMAQPPVRQQGFQSQEVQLHSVPVQVHHGVPQGQPLPQVHFTLPHQAVVHTLQTPEVKAAESTQVSIPAQKSNRCVALLMDNVCNFVLSFF